MLINSQKIIQGISLKILNCICFVFVSIIARLTISNISVSQFFFMSIGTSCLITIMPYATNNNYALLNKKILPYYLTLGLLGSFGMSFWFYILTILPMAYATSLSYTTPFFTTILASFILKEKINKKNILLLINGFIGSLIIIRPKIDSMFINSLLGLLNAFVWSLYDITVKKMQLGLKKETKINFCYVLILNFIFISPLALSGWKTPNIYEILASILTGFLFVINLFLLFNAYQRAPLNILMPFSFTKIIFSSIAGILFFKEETSFNIILGSLLIFFGSISFFIFNHIKCKKN